MTASGANITAVSVKPYQVAIKRLPPALSRPRTWSVGLRRMSGYSKVLCSAKKSRLKAIGRRMKRTPVSCAMFISETPESISRGYSISSAALILARVWETSVSAKRVRVGSLR